MRVVVGACGASMNAACGGPPLVPGDTTFPPQAVGQQSSVRHFFHKLLYGKHGLFCSRLRGKSGAAG